MKIKFNSDDDLSLNKTPEIHNMVIVVSCHENSKYYRYYPYDCLHKLRKI